MVFNDTEKEAMDIAAADAEAKLADLPNESIVPIATWIYDHYLGAGYKRLCRILLQYAIKKPEAKFEPKSEQAK